MAAFCVGASLLGSALLVQPPVRLARVRATRASARMLDEGATEKAEDEVLYALGLTVAKNLAELKLLLQPSEAKVVGAALTDAMCGEERANFDWGKYGPQVETLMTSRQALAQAASSSAGEALLAAAAKEDGAITTASGLVYSELLPGDGASPKPGAQVTAHYTGTLPNGQVFDSSVLRGTPLTFPLGSVIKGWQEGLQMMQVGGRAILTIPADLAYGQQGTGPIPPGAVLRFEVELLNVE